MSNEAGVNTTTAVLDHHLAAFADQDMTEIMADYTDDSVVISDRGTFHGLDDIESGFFEPMFEEFSQDVASMELDERTVDGDVAYITWHAETPDNVYEFATDTFVVRDGVIETQTFGGKITPKD